MKDRGFWKETRTLVFWWTAMFVPFAIWKYARFVSALIWGVLLTVVAIKVAIKIDGFFRQIRDNSIEARRNTEKIQEQIEDMQESIAKLEQEYARK